MRTNIDIDDELMAEALKLSGLKTKREVVDTALKLLIGLKRQQDIRLAFGKLPWHGDLETSRTD